MTVETGALRDKMGERLAWAQIIMGSLVTAYGQLATGINAATIGLSLFFLLLQWGMSYRAYQARLLFRRGQSVTAWLNIIAMVVAAWFVHAALLQALEMAETNGLLVGYDAEMLAGAMILLPFLEPLGFWSHALLREHLATALKARPEPVAKGRPDLRVVGKGAAAVGIGLAPGADALAAPNAAQPPPRERAPIVQMADAQAVQRDKVARAQQMHSEGVNKSEISRRLGVHRNTVGNWLKAA